MSRNQRYLLFIDAAKLLRSLADVIEALADTYRDAEPAEAEVKEEPAVKLEYVRAVLAEKSRNGMTADVKALITKYGADRLSDVNPSHYAGLLKDAEVLGNE